MGLCLLVSDVDNPNVTVNLGKLYGYVPSDSLRSLDWLLRHNKIDDIDYFDYAQHFATTLTAEDYRQFITCYIDDHVHYYADTGNKNYGNTIAIRDLPMMTKLFASNSDKYLNWT